MKTYNFIRPGLKLKKNRVLEFSQSQWSVTFITQKKARNRKKVTKMEKRCTNYRKMNKTDVRLVRLFKGDIKTKLYVT